MKLNISYPATGCQKLVEVVDEHKLRIFYDKRMGAEVQADTLGDEWKGYIVKITGGNDKQGFPMKQGVLTNGRVRLLLSKGHSCYRPRRDGERKRKSVRGCIVDSNLSVLALVIKKKGEQEIPGLTDTTVPRRLGPKRASKIRKLFNLGKEDDVRQFVIKRPLPKKEGQKKQRYKSPKIQRLITPAVLQRKRRRFALIRKRVAHRKDQAAEYAKLLAQRQKEAKAKHKEEVKRRRSASLRASKSSEKSDKPSITAKPVDAPAKPAAKAGAKTAAKPAKVVSKPKVGAAAAPAKGKPTKPTSAAGAKAKPGAAAAKPSAPAKSSSAPKASSGARPPFAKTSLADKGKTAAAAKKPAAKPSKPTGKPGSKPKTGKK